MEDTGTKCSGTRLGPASFWWAVGEQPTGQPTLPPGAWRAFHHLGEGHTDASGGKTMPD